MKKFMQGLKDGIPIGLGYLAVSFAFGIMCVEADLTIWEAVLISMTNLTSAGQFAGVTVITAAGSMLEMAVTEFFINLRYSLMSISLSQKVDDKFTGIHRWLLGYGITDEIFAVAMGNKEEVTRGYFGGLMIVPWIGWSLGTLLGAVCGDVLPQNITVALSVALYGMFIAVVVPKMREDHKVIPVVLVAVVLSCIFRYVPFLSKLSSGYTIIICCVIAALFGAWRFPIAMENNEEVAK